MREKIFATARKVFGVPADQIELCEGIVCVKGQPEKSISLGELASKANPMRGMVEPGVEPGLEATAYYGPPHGATGSGACAIILEVDPDTFKVKIQRFVIVHDCGTVINPLLLDGQIQGGVSMGIGNAFYEKIVYDENGQIADRILHGLPDAAGNRHARERSKWGIGHTKSPLNPLGYEGCWRSWCAAVPPAFAQAFEDAFTEFRWRSWNPTSTRASCIEYVK